MDRAPKEVQGYAKVLDANRVYRPGERVRVEEPHGPYTGLLEMDEVYFVWLIKVQPQERGLGRCDGCQKGRVVARVRHATGPSWKSSTFTSLCEQRELNPGQVVLARRDPRTNPNSDRNLLIGSQNSVIVYLTKARLGHHNSTYVIRSLPNLARLSADGDR